MITYADKDHFIILLVYVNDVIVIGNDHRLNDVFVLNDLGDLNFFFRIEVVKTDYDFHLSQQKYIQ